MKAMKSVFQLLVLWVTIVTATLITSACATITLRGIATAPSATELPLISTLPSLPQPTSVAIPLATPIRGATNLRLWIFHDDNEQALLDAISSAKQRVLMTMYLLTDYRFITALQSAHRNGADVRVLLEENPYRGAAAARQAFDRLTRAGINVKHANPEYRFTHQKSLVIDNAAVIMTANLTKSAFSSNRDIAVMYSDNTDVTEMSRTFDADWNRSPVSQHSATLVWSPGNSRERLGDLIYSANKTIDIYAEVTQDDGITDLLVQAAQRKVDIRLITSPVQSSSEDSNKPNLDTLQQHGISVRYLRNPYIHAKMILVDGTISFIGSQNISATSMEFNRELGVLVADQTVMQRLSAVFQKDWQKATVR